MGMTIDEDYSRFCLKCGWNDSDYGCTSPSGEEVWQCPMYIHYHPAEVEKFNEDMNNWGEVEDGMTKHYYIYKGYWWFYPCTDYKVFHEAQGLIIKCYTDAEFKRYYQDSNCVWEKVEEVENGKVEK